MSYEGWDQMSLSLLGQLVSQAEGEGVTLAEVISRTMTEQQMAAAEEEIRAEVARERSEIEGFMSGLEVASLETYLSMDDGQLSDVLEDLAFALSDDLVVEDEASW